MGDRTASPMLRALPQDLPRQNDSLTLPVRPESFPIAARETALIVVDMQNAYASSGGYIDIRGFDVSGARAVLERIVSGRTKVNALRELLPWYWQAARETLTAAAA